VIRDPFQMPLQLFRRLHSLILKHSNILENVRMSLVVEIKTQAIRLGRRIIGGGTAERLRRGLSRLARGGASRI
jgi:hypothetical protein